MSAGEARYAQILAERARLLARAGDDERRRGSPVSVVVVRVGAARFGLPARCLRVVVPGTEPARLPSVPPWMRGLVLIRGELVAVVDLGRWLGAPGASGPGMFVVVEGARGPVALQVNAVEQLREVHADELVVDPPAAPWSGGLPAQGTTRDLVVLLDLETLLSGDRLLVGAPPARPDPRERS